MHCPRCKTQTLKPTKLAEGLPSFSCGSCNGSLIEILSYRMWCDRNAAANEKSVETPNTKPTDSKQTLVCPKCEKIMLKFSIAQDTSNKIDLCSNCGRFWLDGGEWRLLESINLKHDITSIFNEPWQKSIRQSQAKKAYKEKFKHNLGAEDYSKLEALTDWINSHPKRKEILHYINNVNWENNK